MIVSELPGGNQNLSNKAESKRFTYEVISTMKPYLIRYDLDKPGQNYSGLITKLQGAGAIRVLKSQWALKTSLVPTQIRDALRPLIDSNDRLLIIEIADWASFNILASEDFKKIAA